jgi:anti-sigma regulatory factor (Ser/Thr protein kinase)
MNTLSAILSQVTLAVNEASQVGQVRRHAKQLAASAGFDDASMNNVGIVATELATNLAKHALSGEILLRLATELNAPAVEMLSIDRGPGMIDLTSCLRDGYSTSGTPGSGLGAVTRLSSQFDAYTQPSGTVLMSRVSTGRPLPEQPSTFVWGAAVRWAPHENCCGDAWQIALNDDHLALVVADGLGHGPAAAQAAESALGAFSQDPFASPVDFFRVADARMRGTRGGAVSLAMIDARTRRLSFTGVGNVAGVLISLSSHDEGSRHARRGLVSHNGTVGVACRKVQSFELDLLSDGLLVMHTDGIQTRWDLNAYPGLNRRHPSIVAGVLVRDFLRGRDDATVVVARFGFED